MILSLLNNLVLTTAIALPLLRVKQDLHSGKAKNHNDTSNARYAVNERGLLEEIHHIRLSSQK